MVAEPFVRLDPVTLSATVALAAELHHHQGRKGTGAPYVSHLLGVASLVAEDLGSDDEVAAALLHDAAEDQGGEPVLERIRVAFGDVVAGLVRECSDSILESGVSKAPWRERKTAALERLTYASPSALKIIAADKLHNTRSTVADVALHEQGVWDRFKTGQEGFLWYHRAMAARLAELLPNSRSVRLLQLEVERLSD